MRNIRLRDNVFSVIDIFLVKHEILRATHTAPSSDVTVVDALYVIVSTTSGYQLATPTASLTGRRIRHDVVFHARLHSTSSVMAVSRNGQ